MLLFSESLRYVEGRLARTPFERCYEAPGPAIYDDYSTFDSFVQFADAALECLEWWRNLYREAVLEYVIIPPDTKPKSSCTGDAKRDASRAQQIEWMYDDGAFAEAIEDNGYADQCGWPWGSNRSLERLRQATPHDLAQHWFDMTTEVFEDAREDEAAWLDTGNLLPSVPYLSGVVSANEHAQRQRFADHANQIGCEPSMVGVGEGFDGSEWQESESDLEWRFVEYAAAGKLLMNCLNAKAIQTYRWWFRVDTSHGMSSGFQDEVNLIREGYLAGVRYWIERILAKRIPFQSRDDFAAFDRLARAVLGIVREAYTREAPSTLLGEDERYVLRLTFPLMSNCPAETSVDEEGLRQRWLDTNPDGPFLDENPFGEFLEDFQFLDESLYGKVLSHFHHVMPRKVDTDFECRRVGVALVDWGASEMRRCGQNDEIVVSWITNETVALKIATAIAVRCAAVPNLRFSAVPSDADSAHEQTLGTPNQCDIDADKVVVKSDTLGEEKFHDDQRRALLWLNEAKIWSEEHLKIAEEIWNNCRPIVKETHFKRKMTELKNRNYLGVVRNKSGLSGYWLLDKGREAAERMKAEGWIDRLKK